MKKIKRIELFFCLFSITIFTIFLSNCATKYEQSNVMLQKKSRGASLTEIAYPGFWFKTNNANKLEIIFFDKQLDKQSDAARKGFKEGDTLTRVDNVEILNKHQFFEIIDNKKPDETINITITRNGEFLTKQIRLVSFLIPNTLYVIMKAVYNNERVVLANVVAEFNVAGAGNKEEIDRFKKTILPHSLSIIEGRYIQLLGNENNFKIVNRNDVDRVMSELKLQQSGLISKETQLKLGNMLGATHLLIGDYSFFPLNRNEVTYMVAGRVVDVETGKVLATTVYEDKTNDPKFMQLTRELKTEKVGTTQADYEDSAKPVIEKYNSRKKNLIIQYDSKKWKISETKNNAAIEISFTHRGGDISAYLINEILLKEQPQHVIEDIIIENIRKKGIIKDYRLVSSEMIKVNGVPIDHLYIEGKYEGRTLSIVFYVYTGNAGLVQFYSALPKDLFEEYAPDVMGLLNGLQIIEQ